MTVRREKVSSNGSDKDSKPDRLPGFYVPKDVRAQFDKMVRLAAKIDDEKLDYGKVFTRILRIVRNVDRASLDRLAAAMRAADHTSPPKSTAGKGRSG